MPQNESDCIGNPEIHAMQTWVGAPPTDRLALKEAKADRNSGVGCTLRRAPVDFRQTRSIINLAAMEFAL
jgi:hypothetical protein